jgi:hypothetical protein
VRGRALDQRLSVLKGEPLRLALANGFNLDLHDERNSVLRHLRFLSWDGRWQLVHDNAHDNIRIIPSASSFETMFAAMNPVTVIQDNENVRQNRFQPQAKSLMVPSRLRERPTHSQLPQRDSCHKYPPLS